MTDLITSTSLVIDAVIASEFFSVVFLFARVLCGSLLVILCVHQILEGDYIGSRGGRAIHLVNVVLFFDLLKLVICFCIGIWLIALS